MAQTGHTMGLTLSKNRVVDLWNPLSDWNINQVARAGIYANDFARSGERLLTLNRPSIPRCTPPHAIMEYTTTTVPVGYTIFGKALIFGWLVVMI